MVGEERTVAGGTISAAGWHGYNVTVYRGYGYQADNISGGIDYMAGRTGVMYFWVGCTYRYIVDSTGSSGVTGGTEGGSHYQSCMITGMACGGVMTCSARAVYCRWGVVMNPGFGICSTWMAGKAGRNFEIRQGCT